jgi:hypothetical protein
VEDRCDGTLTQVVEGVVDVEDTTLNKTVSVAAGQSYLAAAPTRGAFKPPASTLSAALERIKKNGLRWAGRTFPTRAAFTVYLRGHGHTWAHFAKKYSKVAKALASRRG